MKPQMVSSFLSKNTRETTKNIKKIVETRSQKKMRRFSYTHISCHAIFEFFRKSFDTKKWQNLGHIYHNVVLWNHVSTKLAAVIVPDGIRFDT